MYNSLTNYMSRMSKQILLFWVQSSFELLFCATFSMEVLQAFHQSKSVQQLKFPENSFTVPVQIKISQERILAIASAGTQSISASPALQMAIGNSLNVIHSAFNSHICEESNSLFMYQKIWRPNQLTESCY